MASLALAALVRLGNDLTVPGWETSQIKHPQSQFEDQIDDTLKGLLPHLHELCGCFPRLRVVAQVINPHCAVGMPCFVANQAQLLPIFSSSVEVSLPPVHVHQLALMVLVISNLRNISLPDQPYHACCKYRVLPFGSDTGNLQAIHPFSLLFQNHFNVVSWIKQIHQHLLRRLIHSFVASCTRGYIGFSRCFTRFSRKNYQIFPQTGKCTFRPDLIGYNSAVEGAMTRPVHVLVPEYSMRLESECV